MDDCLEYEAYERSHTTHNIVKLDREVPKNIMSGKNADISQFCVLSWYKLVEFHSTTIFFPEYLLVFGKYLGPLIDVSPAMVAKVLTTTGKLVYCST